MLKVLLAIAMTLPAAIPVSASSSYYPAHLDDAKAVYLTHDRFPVHADGLADDSDVIQQAVNKVQETTNQGILFIPAGRYRLSKTIYVWPGIRLTGFGATRPVFVLGAHAPAFQQGPAYMIFFAGFRPGSVPASPGTGRIFPPVNATPPDANPGTFYSAISNLDIEIQEGNQGAVGIRARYAQHCFLAHMDFHIGSGLAGIHDGGNLAQDVHFYGGQYGIWTRKPSPGWQFTIIDASFEGQREAAIREHEAGLTLVRPQFKNVPTAISIDPKYSDELWVKDGRMENVTGSAVVVSNENNAHTEINFENIAAPRPGFTTLLPVNYWRNENDFTEAALVKKPYQFLSSDGSTFIPPGKDFVSGELYYGSKLHDVLRAFGMAPAIPGQPLYVSDESEDKTYAATVADDGNISDLRLFAEQGGESVTVDEKGNVYIAAGQVFVYDPAGHLIDTVEVPERPSQLLFGGSDRKTLFILARSSLYAVQTRYQGRR